MTSTNDRATRLLSKLDAAWAEFHASYASLSDKQLLEPGVTGDWSVRDTIAHLTWWDAEALRHLPVIVAGGHPPRYRTTYGGIDAFNRQMHAQRRASSLADVLRQAHATHEQLVAYLQRLPPEQWLDNSRFRRRLRLDTYVHYPLHTAEIRAWRARHAAGYDEEPG